MQRNLQIIPKSDLVIGELIGHGGYGDVYKAEWHGTGVAVKQLHLKTLTSSLQEEFNHEAEIMVTCQFPHIVSLYGICQETSYNGLVMELMPMGSLYGVLHNKEINLEWNTRWEIAIGVGKGVSYLHSKNILHRDLKSLNVLLGNDYHVKLCDFGLSKIKLESSSITTKNTAGSVRWSAPEALKRGYKPASSMDVYSYGMVLWEIVSRALPFSDAANEITAGMWIQSGEKEIIPPLCPAAYAAEIQKCWQDADKRPSAQEIVSNLIKAKSESESEFKPEQKSKPELKPEPKPQAKPEAKPELKPKPEPKPESKPKPELKPELKPKLELKPEPKPEPKQKETISIAQPKKYVAESWHFDPATKRKATLEEGSKNPYELLDATEKDKQKVIEFYQHDPVPNYEIASVKVIYNKTFNQKFNLQLETLQERRGGEGFMPKWPNENDVDWRAATYKQLVKISEPYKDYHYPSIKLIPLWHGTRPELLDSIFRTGYANLATTDGGYYGKGIYGSYEAKYAYQVYAKGALILNWGAVFSAYPVIHGDMSKLTGKGNYQNYDAHFIPVVPKNPCDQYEVSYLPCRPNQKPVYRELVTFESASCLPRYLVELRSSAPQINKLGSFQPKNINNSQNVKVNPPEKKEQLVVSVNVKTNIPKKLQYPANDEVESKTKDNKTFQTQSVTQTSQNMFQPQQANVIQSTSKDTIKMAKTPMINTQKSENITQTYQTMFQPKLELPKQPVQVIKPKTEFYVAVVGSAESGKSCLNTRFLKDTYPEGEKKWFLDNSKNIDIDNKPYKLMIWEGESFHKFKEMDAVIIAIDLDNPVSLLYANNILQFKLRFYKEGIKLVLAGTKSDLNKKHKIDNACIAALEENIPPGVDYIGYFETSAKTGSNVEGLFRSIAKRFANFTFSDHYCIPKIEHKECVERVDTFNTKSGLVHIESCFGTKIKGDQQKDDSYRGFIRNMNQINALSSRDVFVYAARLINEYLKNYQEKDEVWVNKQYFRMGYFPIRLHLAMDYYCNHAGCNAYLEVSMTNLSSKLIDEQKKYLNKIKKYIQEIDVILDIVTPVPQHKNTISNKKKMGMS